MLTLLTVKYYRNSAAIQRQSAETTEAVKLTKRFLLYFNFYQLGHQNVQQIVHNALLWDLLRFIRHCHTSEKHLKRGASALPLKSRKCSLCLYLASAVVSTLASQQEGSGLNSSLGALYVLSVQRHDVRLMGNPKLPVGASGCFCIRSATDWGSAFGSWDGWNWISGRKQMSFKTH